MAQTPMTLQHGKFFFADTIDQLTWLVPPDHAAYGLAFNEQKRFEFQTWVQDNASETVFLAPVRGYYATFMCKLDATAFVLQAEASGFHIADTADNFLCFKNGDTAKNRERQAQEAKRIRNAAKHQVDYQSILNDIMEAHMNKTGIHMPKTRASLPAPTLSKTPFQQACDKANAAQTNAAQTNTTKVVSDDEYKFMHYELLEKFKKWTHK